MTFFDIIASIGITLLTTIIFFVINYGFLAVRTSTETGRDGKKYTVKLGRYSDTLWPSCIEMIIILALIIIKKAPDESIVKSIGISVLFSFMALGLFALGGALIYNKAYKNAPQISYNSVEEEIKGQISAKEDKYILGFAAMVLSDGILLTILLRMFEVF